MDSPETRDAWRCVECANPRPKTGEVGWAVNQDTREWFCPVCAPRMLEERRARRNCLHCGGTGRLDPMAEGGWRAPCACTRRD